MERTFPVGRILCLWFLFAAIHATAQDEGIDIVESYNATTGAIGQKQHSKALKICNSILSQYGTAEEGMELFGPVYGHWFYLRGLAQIGLENWSDASQDFKACYNCTNRSEKVFSCQNCRGFGRVHSTKKTDRDQDGKMPCPSCGGIPYRENSQPNQFRLHALVQWGNCEMIEENYAKARDLYKKALAEDYENKLSRNWKLYTAVNLGRCLIKAGDVEEGYEYTVRALDQPGFDSKLKQTVFQILAEDWSPLVKAERVHQFLNKYRHVPMNVPIEDRVPLNASFYNLANMALEKQDPMLGLAWLRLIAHPGEVITDFDHSIALLEALRESDPRKEITPLIDDEIGKQKKQRDLLKANLWAMLSSNGMSHYMLKNYGASLAVYDGLSNFAPRSHKGRPEFLHNAVVSAVQTGDWMIAYKHGIAFLNDYPDHKLKPGVVRVLVEVMYINGKYQEAYDVSKEVREEMELGSSIRDIPDFIYGAAAYQLGKYHEAEDALTSYLENYIPAQRDELARFYLGSTKVKFYKWQEGADLFDPFLKAYPGSAVTSSVLYQNGLCKFMLDDNETARPLVARLLKEFPTSEEIPEGWNLQGDIQTVDEVDFDTEIKSSYENGIATSVQYPGKEEVAAYALWQLVMNLTELERWEEAGEYFDRFQKEYPESAYQVDMLIAGLQMLVELGRAEEAIERQETLLFTTGGDPERGELGELFGTYLEFIEENDPGNVKSRLENLFFSPKSSSALKSWTVIGEIEMLEKADGDNDEEIQSGFYRLNNKFDPAQNSNYVIVRLARWNSETRRKPEEAARLYDFILNSRDGTADYDLALLDRAQIDAKSELPEDRQRAMTNFDRILNEFGNAELAEDASVGVARLLTRDKNYTEALPRWEAYMDNPSWNKYAAEANFNYGLCLDQTGKTAEAMVVYINTYNAFPGHVEFSTPSYLRAALLMKEKGEDLKALLILKDMLTRLKAIEHPNIEKGHELFQKWRSEYVPPAKKGAKS